jgi:MerR family transcriptional regulator, copper efflux regulator
MSIAAIRRFEALGLIYSAGRSPANYRLFDDTALWCIEAIRALRSLGLTLREVTQLAAIYLEKPSEVPGPAVATLLDRAEVRIVDRLGELEAIRGRIAAFRSVHGPALAGVAGSELSPPLGCGRRGTRAPVRPAADLHGDPRDRWDEDPVSRLRYCAARGLRDARGSSQPVFRRGHLLWRLLHVHSLAGERALRRRRRTRSTSARPIPTSHCGGMPWSSLVHGGLASEAAILRPWTVGRWVA